jgi:hypothetical protein
VIVAGFRQFHWPELWNRSAPQSKFTPFSDELLADVGSTQRMT